MRLRTSIMRNAVNARGVNWVQRRKIMIDHASGMSVKDLTLKYRLSDGAIRKILQRGGEA